MGLSEDFFWRLTPVEYQAQYRQWATANGVKMPLTKEEKDRLAWNKAYIMEQQRRALNKETERQKVLHAEKIERQKQARVQSIKRRQG